MQKGERMNKVGCDWCGKIMEEKDMIEEKCEFFPSWHYCSKECAWNAVKIRYKNENLKSFGDDIRYG